MQTKSAPKKRSKATPTAKPKPTTPTDQTVPRTGLSVSGNWPGYAADRYIEKPDVQTSIKKWREEYLPNAGGADVVEVMVSAAKVDDCPWTTAAVFKIAGPPGTLEKLCEEVERCVSRFAVRQRNALAPSGARDIGIQHAREIHLADEAEALAESRGKNPERDRFRVSIDVPMDSQEDESGGYSGSFGIQTFNIEAPRGTIERAAEALHDFVTSL